MSSRSYRFHFQVVDPETEEVIEENWATLSEIDQFGGCESVDHQVASTLRAFNRFGRAEYERRLTIDEIPMGEVR